MARIPYIEEKDHPELASLIGRIKTERGELLDPYKVLLNSPELMDGWLGFFVALRRKAKLKGRYRELAIMRVAILNRAEYEYENHLPFALKEGATSEQMATLKAWQLSSLFDATERAVLAYTDAMTKEIQVPDELFAEVRKHFDAQELVELTVTIGAYNLVSRFLEAMQLHHQA